MDNWLEKDRQNIWHPFTPLIGGADPIMITSAKGIYLHTHDGRKIIDAVSSWWTNLHGHSNPHIAAAIARQANNLEHVIFAGFTHEPAIKLSENLLTILPKNQSKIFFSDNGSTAVEVGIKMALQYWYNKGTPKKKVIAMNGSYHGDTFGSMSVGERNIFTDPFSKHLFDVDFIDFPTRENEEIVLTHFYELIKKNDVAAFIVEPLVQGAGGMRMYSPAILDKLFSAARSHEVVCIADEVFTGFGRTGKNFASQYLTLTPDIMALSKGLTGGTLPLSITTCSEEIIQAFRTDDFTKTFFHGHSYTGNPLACAVANASFELLMKMECQDAIQRIAASHEQFRNEMSVHPAIKDARCLGTILALEIKNDEDTSYSNAIRKKIYPYFLEQGILLRPLGNVIYIVPPFVIKNDELQIIYHSIKKFLDLNI